MPLGAKRVERLVGQKKIGKLQSALRGVKKSRRRMPSKTADFASHVGLIRVAQERCHIRQRLRSATALAQMQESLQTKYRFKHLWTVTKRSRKAAMYLSLTHPGPLAELLDPATGTLGKPVHARDNDIVWWTGKSETGRQRLRESMSARGGTLFMRNMG